MSDRRSAVFLEEMGVGPQWRLRARAASADVADAAEVADAADVADFAASDEPAFAPPAQVQADAPQAAVVARPPAPAAEQQAPVGRASATPQQAPGKVQAPAAAEGARQAMPSEPGTPSVASTGEDMSWFDDAPTPEYKPQRKKVAAPEQPVEAPSQRPAAAPARPAPMPAYEVSPVDEPPSWFDDDQAATSGMAPATAGSASQQGQPTDEQIAHMDWPALQAAISACTRCGRCDTRQQAIPGRGDEQAAWLALDTAPGQAEDSEGQQFAGDPGYLLDNMLKAVGQSTEKGAYLTSLVKCHAPSAPSAEELQACRPYLERELELTQAKVIVAFGHLAGKGLLGGAARGRIMLHGSVPVVATYHPADLLKKPEEKAKAWQDLCLAKAAHAGRR